MTIDLPAPDQIPQLRVLWQAAFGDTDAFLDIFFHRAFAPERSRCITQDGRVVAALYWFDCSWGTKNSIRCNINRLCFHSLYIYLKSNP